VPGVYVALPSVFATLSATTGTSVSVSVALSFDDVESMTLAGGKTVAVFAIEPVAFAAICAVTV
jgi:hypothetical protein